MPNLNLDDARVATTLAGSDSLRALENAIRLIEKRLEVVMEDENLVIALIQSEEARRLARSLDELIESIGDLKHKLLIVE